MKLRISLLTILIGMLFASCGLSTGKVAEQKEEGISVLRYDKLLSEYVRSNSFSAMVNSEMAVLFANACSSQAKKCAKATPSLRMAFFTWAISLSLLQALSKVDGLMSYVTGAVLGL